MTDITPIEDRYTRPPRSYSDSDERRPKSDWRKRKARNEHIKSLPFDVTDSKGKTLLTWLDSDGTDGLTERVTVPNGEILVDTRLDESTRKTYDSQAAACRAFERYQYKPDSYTTSGYGTRATRNEPHFTGYSSPNYQFVHYTDGSGEIVHYRTRACIRTSDGTVINNSQDFGGGFATVTQPSSPYPAIPLDGIDTVLDDAETDSTIWDIETVHTANQARISDGYGTRRQYPLLVELADGSGVVVMHDSTAKDRTDQICGFYVTSMEVTRATTVFDLERLLIPERARGTEIVPVDRMNPGYASSRSDDAGTVTQRQGEWFFVPTHVEPQTDVSKPLTDGGTTSMDNHVPRDYADLRRTCDACGASSFDVSDTVTCKECGTDQPPLVRGTVRHSRNEHYMARLGETWHVAVTHDRDVAVFDMSTNGNGGGTRGFD